MSNFDFSKMSLLIGIPAYQRWLAQPLIDSLNRFTQLAFMNRLNFAQSIVTDTDIAQARNEMVAQFLVSEMAERRNPDGTFVTKPVTHLLMIDDDISFDPQVIFQMLASRHPVVAGVVPQRKINWKKVGDAARAGVPDEQLMGAGLTYNIGVKTAADHSQLNLEVAPDGTVEVDRVGGAFLLIERSVFGIIEAQCPPEGRPHFTYQSTERWSEKDTGSRFNFFQRGLFGEVQDGKGQYMGEDFFFSELCLGSGIPVRAYAPAAFGHFGQIVFQGQPLLLPKS